MTFNFYYNYRHDMSKSMNYYWQEENARDSKKMADEWPKKKKFSCAHPPLLKVHLKNIVIDELHLMLRVTGNIHVKRGFGVIFICP